MAGIALSKFGIMPADFYNLTPIEFSYALIDKFKSEERIERFELEKMRLQTLYLVNCHLKDPPDSVTKLMPFKWDEVQKAVEFVPTEEDWKYYDELAKKWQPKQ